MPGPNKKRLRARLIARRASAFLAALLLVIPTYTTPAAAGKNTALVYSKKKNSGQKIALTFDDGPHPVYTDKILDILREYGIPATFFVVGENASLYPDIIVRIVDEGHEIGNHTYYHRHLTKSKTSLIKKEIQMCESAIYEICEYKTKLFRPPEGVLPDSVCRYAANEDYVVILWSIDTRDWAHTPVSLMVETVESKIASGEIILMHDYIVNSKTPETLRIIIPHLLEAGYKFVTVSELIGSE